MLMNFGERYTALPFSSGKTPLDEAKYYDFPQTFKMPEFQTTGRKQRRSLGIPMHQKRIVQKI